MTAPGLTLWGRSRERQRLDDALDHVRGGHSAVLVLRGQAGVGKTTLLQYVARQATDCRITRITGVESELELPFAALHQLCGTVLEGLETLPEPQARALKVAFGLAEGNVPDRFVLGLAVLGLLAEAAANRPLVCVVDDAQWLDEATRQVLGVVGRRLDAESVLLLLAVRETPDEHPFPGLPDLVVEGLDDEDARVLLAAEVPGPLDDRVRDRLVAETGGNPLALLELVKGTSEAELAGGFAIPPTATLTGHLQEHYLQRVRSLPAPTQLLMLVAAADPTGDATLLWRAARALEVGPEAVGPAEAQQLLDVGSAVRFRHPLVRSAAYAAGSPEDRVAAHRALADATDPQTGSRPEGVAPSGFHLRPGRRCRRRPRTLGGPCAGPGRAVGCGRVPAACGGVDRGPGAACGPGPGGRTREPARGRVRGRVGPVSAGGGRRGRRPATSPGGAAPRRDQPGLHRRQPRPGPAA